MSNQPYIYRRRALAEPDWRRFPGWAQVSAQDWESPQWQRSLCVKNSRQLAQVAGPGLSEGFLADLERDQRERATMSLLLPPQMLNTMVPDRSPGDSAQAFTEAFYSDPVRRYMLPVFSDRRPAWVETLMAAMTRPSASRIGAAIDRSPSSSSWSTSAQP